VKDEKLSIEELKEKVDMSQLKEFSPKLHGMISENPALLLDLQDIIVQRE
jgi:hypothetical protein